MPRSIVGAASAAEMMIGRAGDCVEALHLVGLEDGVVERERRFWDVVLAVEGFGIMP